MTDPFRDLRSGYFFSVSAAGVLWDGTLFNDMGSDDTWDGVWEGRARREGAKCPPPTHEHRYQTHVARNIPDVAGMRS